MEQVGAQTKVRLGGLRFGSTLRCAYADRGFERMPDWDWDCELGESYACATRFDR